MNTSVNISIYLTEKFLEAINEAMRELGFNSRSEFFHTAARFYIKSCNIEEEMKIASAYNV